MKRLYVLLSLLVAGILALSACAPQVTPTPRPTPTTAPAPTVSPQATPTPTPAAPGATPAATARPATARPAWEGEWESLKEAAKKEKRMVIVGGAVGSEVRAGVSAAFKEKFDVDVEFLPGRGAEQVAKLTQERQAGIFSADAYVGGGTTPTTQLKPKEFMESLDKVLFLPEVLEDKNWRQYGVFYDKAHMIAGGFSTYKTMVYVNSELVKAGELKSFNDLLDPKWKGKIVINDPTTMGSGKDSVEAIRHYMGEDYLKKLVEQKPVVIRDQRQQVEWVARGKYPVGLGIPDSITLEFIRAGASMAAVTMTEGVEVTTGIGCVGLFNRSPHPNAAKLFLNWILTKEGQTVFAKLAGHASRRADVDNEWMPPHMRPQPGINFYVTGAEELQLKGEERMKLFRDIFKPVM